MKHNKADVDLALHALRGCLSPNTTIHTFLRHRSESGLTRWYDAYIIKDNDLFRLTWSIATVLDYSYDRRWDALKIQGYGFSATNEIALGLGQVLHNDPTALLLKEH